MNEQPVSPSPAHRSQRASTPERRHPPGPPEPSPLALRLRPPIGDDANDEDWNPQESASDRSDDGGDVKGAASFASPLKRSAGDDLLMRPFKRQKGLLNIDYLDLLNRDIEDAAERVSLDDKDNLVPSQLGLVSWSALEKRVFFESIARMGRDDLQGIAARIESKSALEVKQYIELLEQEKEARRVSTLRPALDMADYPAAVELSQPCCHALEETADTISVRQERREQQREESKWGRVWDLTPGIATELERGNVEVLGGQILRSLDLFDLGQWLKLSRHMFMNSSIPNENWTYIDEAPPSIWATTMEDFYSLAVSITRRIVQTVIFTSMSRNSARQRCRHGMTRNVISRSDVEAALSSLGMTTSSNQFWRESARRLRLNVYKDVTDREVDDTTAVFLSFEQVESMLASPGTKDGIGEEEEQEMKEEVDMEEEILASSAGEEEDEGGKEEQEREEDTSDDEGSTLDQEANEVLRHSAADFPETWKMRQALKNRVAIEQRQEQHADLCDDHASYQAELEMWELLQRDPPMELPKKPAPGAPSRSGLDVQSIYPLGRGWRAHTEPRSEWEAAFDTKQ